MKKFILGAILIIACCFVKSTPTFALDYVEVNDFSSLYSALLPQDSAVKLTSDITATGNLFTTKGTTLDLNGHTLNIATYGFYIYENATILDGSAEKTGKVNGAADFPMQIGNSTRTGDLTIKSGEFYFTGKYGIRVIGGSSLTIDGGSVNAKRYAVYNQGTTTLNDGELHARNHVTIQNHTNAVLEINGGKIITDADYQAINMYGSCKATMNDGEIIAMKEGDPYTGNGIMMFKDTEFIMNGGKITSYGAAILGNGSVSGGNEGTNAKVTITGGDIKATNDAAIYIPQPNGVTTISGGTIEGTTAIEIRAGTLNITGGTLTGTSDTYNVIPNTNGGTTTGAAVAIAQHTTKQPINVIISGGTFSAPATFSFANPLNNPQEDLDKITFEITGGTFDNTGSDTIVMTEPRKFITGGSYDKNVEDYVAEDFVVVEEAGRYVVKSVNSLQPVVSDTDDESDIAVPNTGNIAKEGQSANIFHMLEPIALGILMLAISYKTGKMIAKKITSE